MSHGGPTTIFTKIIGPVPCLPSSGQGLGIPGRLRQRITIKEGTGISEAVEAWEANLDAPTTVARPRFFSAGDANACRAEPLLMCTTVQLNRDWRWTRRPSEC